MAKTRAQKEEILKQLKEELKKRQVLILANYERLKSENLFELRHRLEEKGNKLMVVKNTLLDIALREQKIKIPSEILKQPLAVAFATDEIEPSKIIWSFARENENLKILGGIFEGQFGGKEKIAQLAVLPSREELYCRLLGVLEMPKRRFLNALIFNQIKFINLMKQLSQEKK